MAKYELTQAVSAIADVKSRIINLWTWFVVGNFAAVAAIFNTTDPDIIALSVSMFAYWVYAMGNYSLLQDEIVLKESIRNDIENHLSSDKHDCHRDFVGSLQMLARIEHPVIIIFLAHFAVSLSMGLVILFGTFESKLSALKQIELVVALLLGMTLYFIFARRGYMRLKMSD